MLLVIVTAKPHFLLLNRPIQSVAYRTNSCEPVKGLYGMEEGEPCTR